MFVMLQLKINMYCIICTQTISFLNEKQVTTNPISPAGEPLDWYKGKTEFKHTNHQKGKKAGSQTRFNK